VTSTAATPAKVGVFVLATLIFAACIANINLTVANVALPDIGRELGATQIQLNMVAVGFTLGLACSVLYLGALGDRYGRKKLLLLGLALSIPTAALAAWAPDPNVLILARFLGGVCAGMVYPTTLSIITALYTGKQRVLAIALWSGIGAGASAVGPAVVGWLLTFAWWGAGFAITIPLAAIAFVLCLFLPRKTGDISPNVDHVGGLLSVVMIATLIAAITFAPTPGQLTVSIVLFVISLIGFAAFYFYERHAANPIFSLVIAKRRTFWVAAIAGLIVFGSLMGAMFIGQQFLQNVLAYSPFEASIVVLPTAVMTAICGQLAGRVISARGSRISFLVGLAAIAASFAVMLATWQAGAWLGWVLIAYALIGVGVGFAATPASRALMGSVPPRRTGMGSAFLDLTRDFGGAVIQALMGVILAGVYAASLTKVFNSLPPDQASQLGDQAAQQIVSSYESAAQVATQFPQPEAQQIIEAASKAFTEGKSAAISVGLVLTLGAVALVYALFPRKADE